MDPEIYGRIALALALFGPPLIGLIVPITSGVLLRKRHGVRPALVAGALVVWVAASVGAAFCFMRIALFTAMGWAHLHALAPTGEQIELLAIVFGGLVLLIGLGMLLHRLLIRVSGLIKRPLQPPLQH